MLDFPNAPTVGEKYPAAPVAGVPTYIWDGEKWTSAAIAKPGYLPLIGGTLSGPLILAADPAVPLGAATRQYSDMPTLGVTDGGEASAGRVGEVLSTVRTSPIALATSTGARVVSLILTPGDWDISGEVWTTASAGGIVTSFWAAINLTDAASPAAVDMIVARSQFGAGTSTLGVAPVGPCRATVAVATTYYLNCLFNFASGSITATGKLWARRAR